MFNAFANKNAGIHLLGQTVGYKNVAVIRSTQGLGSRPGFSMDPTSGMVSSLLPSHLTTYQMGPAVSVSLPPGH